MERAVLGAWCSLTFLFALPGSILTLYGSIKCKAVRLNRVSRALINNIAVADLTFTLLVNLPVMLAIFLDKWIFGDLHCKITLFFEEIFAFADFNMIFALSLSKLAMLRYPLQAKTWSRSRSYAIVSLMWIIAGLIGLQTEVFVSLGLQNMSSFYEHEGLYMCILEPDHSHSAVHYFEVAEFTLLTVVPTLAVAVSSVLLIILANRRQKVKKEAVLAVILISGVYCTCSLPIGLLFIFELDSVKVMKQVAYFSPFLNSAANFPIYCLSLRTVRQFACAKLGLTSSSSSFGRVKGQVLTRLEATGPKFTSPSTSARVTGRRCVSTIL
jgi:hypothetical protein